MNRVVKSLVSLAAFAAVGSAILLGQNGSTLFGVAPQSPGDSGVPFVQPYFYSNPAWYGYGFAGYFSPFLHFPSNPPPRPYMPDHWWVSAYPLADPRQAGYNPSAGYPKESVTTLLLATSPAKSRVTIDGSFVGTADRLGPFQLPLGEHTLRVEAAGYEPSDTILRIEEPILRQLEIHLNPSKQAAIVSPPARDPR